MIKKLTYFLLGCLGLASCAIENDIPYPLQEASISSIEVEGQRAAEGATDAAAVIDKAAGTVTLYVNDSVDITRLKITRLVLDPRDATIGIDSVLCDNYEKFPTNDFASLDSLPLSANTRVDFSKPVTMTLSTYQDYPWKVTVNQIIQRDVDVVGMNNYVLDVNSRNVIIYVGSDQNLSDIQINKLNLGGEYGKVTPDPTTVHDFTKSQTFYAARHGEDTWQEWKVFIYQTEEGGSTGSSDVFAMVTRATVKGSVQSGKTPTIEYRKQGASDWSTVPTANVTTSGTSFTATLTGLSGSTTYNYRVTVDGVAGSEQSFTTVAPVALENGSMENWSQDGKQWNPWGSGDTPFWGTGNEGSSILSSIGNITSPTEESVSGKAAYLESKDAWLKLAAGNLFIGDFELDGTNGLLHFGRPFTSFPTALRLYYKYTPSIISIVGSSIEATLPSNLKNMVGQSDLFQIYIALSDKSEPYEIRNDPNKRQLFDPNDANIVAYGEYTSSEPVTSYKELEIPLEYRYTNRTPKYIIIVASSSKYGDYYLGGVGSKLWLDEMELVYE